MPILDLDFWIPRTLIGIYVGFQPIQFWGAWGQFRVISPFPYCFQVLGPLFLDLSYQI